MLIAEVKKLNPFQRWLYWIQEREAIRLKKAAGSPKPWTDDEILRSYRFCNIRRMDDKVSVWLQEHWYAPYYNHRNMLVACAIARHFNQPSALAYITEYVFRKYDPDTIKDVLRDLKSSGETIFNGAYMVRGIGEIDKTEMVISRVCQPLYDNPPKLDFTSMQRSVEALLPYWGFSTFMAGQVVADLRWAANGSLASPWKDAADWAPVGPGSARGLNRLVGRPIKTPVKQNEFLPLLRELIGKARKELPGAIHRRLEGIDWQNTLCEYDKYTRALLGEGRPKQVYNGGCL